MLLTIVVFVLILGFLVLVHELGHFLTARRLKVGVEEFGLGLPPRIVGWTKKGIIYSLNAIPLGGFVKIKGEDGEVKNEPDSFAGRPVWQRLIILVSGVTMNIAAAWLILIFLFSVGMPVDSSYRLQARPVPSAAASGAKATFVYITRISQAFGGIIAGVWRGQELGGKLGGPVAIAAATGDVVALGWRYVLLFTAVLSLNLAVINILPFPALDGGRALFLLIEKIRGRPGRKQTEEWSHRLGFALLMLLAVFITYHDITRFGGRIWRAFGG